MDPVRPGRGSVAAACVVVVGALLAPGCSSSSAGSGAGGDDEAGVIQHPEAGTDDATADQTAPEASTHTACTPDRPFTPAYAWEPPTGPWPLRACTAAQIQELLTDCLDTSNCNAFTNDPDAGACVNCVFTASGNAAYGPIIVVKGSNMSSTGVVNFGGCVAHFDGDASATGCGEKDEYLNDCLTFSCGDCTDFATDGPRTDACVQAAEGAGGACATYVDAKCLAEESTGVASLCNHIADFVGLWCGMGSTDGGGADGAPGD